MSSTDFAPEPADLADPDLDNLTESYDQYVQGLLDARDELLDQRRHHCIKLECVERELRLLGVEF